MLHIEHGQASVLFRGPRSRTMFVVDEPLIFREELTGTLFAIADIREDVREIRDLLSEDDGGEDAEEGT